jgi:hypothetical protein
MFILSKDGSRLIETKSLGIQINRNAISNRNEYGILADDKYIMELFDNEYDAKYKLKMMMASVGAGKDMFEF